MIGGSLHQGPLPHLPSRGRPREWVREHVRKPRVAQPPLGPGSSNTARNTLPLNPESPPAFAAVCGRRRFCGVETIQVT